MFESSWMEAEKALRSARKWVFIGYSLPGADFEFKYLLKRIALSRRSTPIIQVVTKARMKAKKDSYAVTCYKRFFGECQPEFFRDGLTSEVIEKILE
jgi:DNA polymerase elongation subunit (family B)